MEPLSTKKKNHIQEAFPSERSLSTHKDQIRMAFNSSLQPLQLTNITPRYVAPFNLQKSHLNGFSPVWPLTWRRSLSMRLKVLLQYSQLYGLSPVWTRMWRSKSFMYADTNEQSWMVQWNFLSVTRGVNMSSAFPS